MSYDTADNMKKDLNNFYKKLMEQGELTIKSEFEKNMKLAELCRQEGYYPGMYDYLGRAQALVNLLDSVKK